VDAIDVAHMSETKARYEALLRETYGDAVYEKKYKRDLDAAFAQLDAPKGGADHGHSSERIGE